MGGLRRGVTYTVNQLMHSECGRICRGAVGEGGLIRGGLLYVAINGTAWPDFNETSFDNLKTKCKLQVFT